MTAGFDGFGIRDLETSDHDSSRALITLAFGQADEAELVEAVRQAGDVRFELIAETAEGLIGHIMFCSGRVETATECGPSMQDAAILGEMAVAPEKQKFGIGTAFVQAGLARLDEQNEEICFVVGHTDYYPRFGFSAGAALPFTCKWPGPAFMARIARSQDWMRRGGILHFPQAYDRFE